MSNLPVMILVTSKNHSAHISGDAHATLKSILHYTEAAIVSAVYRSEGTWKATARALGISREGLRKKRKRLGL